MKMCHDDEYSYLINLALSDVDRYTARQEGSITFLDLQNTQGQTLIVLRRHAQSGHALQPYVILHVPR